MKLVNNYPDQESSEESSEIEDPAEALKRFHYTLFECADTIQGICESEEEVNAHKYTKSKMSPFIVMLKVLLQLFNAERLVQHYCRFVLPHKDQIDERDREFFLDNDNIYPGAPKENLKFFKALWLDYRCGSCNIPYYEKKDEIGKKKIFCATCDKKTTKLPAQHFHFNEDEQDIVIEHFEIMLDYCELWKDLTGYMLPDEMDKDNT